MKRFFVCIFTLAISLAATSPDTNSKIDALFARWTKQNMPGVAVGVIQNGKILFQKGYGLSNLQTKAPITPETVFDLGSVSKQFTAYAVMILEERSDLSYDDPLTKYFPEFPAYAQKITIRHLLQHTSGLPDYEAALLREGKMDKDYPRVTKRPGWDYEPTSLDAVHILAKVSVPRFAAGDEWEYSNSGYMVLAQIVAKVTGQRFADFMQQNIFRPLGMNHTLVLDEKKPAVPNRASSYTWEKGKFENLDYTPINWIYGDGSVNSNIEDMLEWLQVLDEHKLVNPVTMKTALTSGILNLGASTGYGFGWYLGRTLGLPKISHTGSWAGYRNCMVFYPEEHFGIVILSNNDQIDYTQRSDLTFKIAGLYLQDKFQMPKTVTLNRKDEERFVGRYETEDGSKMEIKWHDQTLWAYSEGEERKRLIPESAVKFFIDGLEDDRFFFHEGGSGKITGVTRRMNFWGFNSTAFSELRKVK